MKLTFKAVLLTVTCSLSMVACQNKGGGEAIINDSQRSISQPRFQFVPKNQPLKNSDIDREGWNKLLDCENPSTNERLDKEKYKVASMVIKRSQGIVRGESEFILNSPIGVKGEEETYSTKDSGVNHTETYTLSALKFGAEDFLPNGIYSYSDSCTDGKCNEDSRQPLAGTPRYAATALTKFEKAFFRSILLQSDSMLCEFKRDTKAAEPQEMVEEGEVVIGGKTYKAVRKTYTENGKVYCQSGAFLEDGSILGESETFEIGKAKSISVDILLADKLVKAPRSSFQSSLGNSCSRTGVFASEHIQLDADNEVVAGISSEVAHYALEGDVTPLDEWEAKQDAIQAKTDRLREAVSEAEAHLSKMVAAEAEANASKGRLKRDADEARNKATRTAVINDIPAKTDTEEEDDYEKRIALELQTRKDNLEVAESAHLAAIDAHTRSTEATSAARLSLSEAEANLERHLRKIAKD